MRRAAGRVGPNAAIQLLRRPAARRRPGDCSAHPRDGGRARLGRPPARRHGRRAAGGCAPSGDTRDSRFADALAVLTEAGSRTGDYLLANRIPVWARAILKALPAAVSSRLLARAIAAHAWTFVGSGRFVCNPGEASNFEIWSNPFCAGERSDAPTCVLACGGVRAALSGSRIAESEGGRNPLQCRGDACCRFALNRIRR